MLFGVKEEYYAQNVYIFSTVCAYTGGRLAQGIDPGAQNLTHSWTFNDGTANDYVGGLSSTLIGGASVNTEGVLWTSDQDQWMEMPGGLIALDFTIQGDLKTSFRLWMIRMKKYSCRF